MNKYYYQFKISILLLFLIQALGCNTQKNIPNNEEFKYSIENPIEGQLHTAKRLKILMSEKKYEESINLFSKKQQTDIRKIQNENNEIFNYWCSAWTLDDKAYEYFCSRIKSGNGMFAFEDGEWRIDEK